MGFSCGAAGWNNGVWAEPHIGRRGQNQQPRPCPLLTSTAWPPAPFYLGRGRGALNLGIQFCGGLGQRGSRENGSSPMADLETSEGLRAGVVNSGPRPRGQGACARRGCWELCAFPGCVCVQGTAPATSRGFWKLSPFSHPTTQPRQAVDTG